MSAALMPTYARAPLAFESGDGPYLVDKSGRRYLDFTSGIGVTALGHAHPQLVAALTEQAGKVWHTSNLFEIPAQTRLAERLAAASFADRVFFANSGVEAVECAFKLVRRYHDVTGRPGRYRVITFEGAFHGRTLAAIAAGGQEKHLDGFDPVVDGFDQVPFDDMAALENGVTDETAAILLEPVQGESGIRPFTGERLRAVRGLADEHGLLLVFDEVQCGMGRTGRLFAHEWSDVRPDVMVLAKGLGGGFPIGACLATEDAAQGMTAGVHGTTFGGNPLAMTVANAVLDVVLAPGFLDRVGLVANRLRQQLARLVDDHGAVLEEVRGLGLMIGLKCRCPNTDLIAALRERGLLAVGAGDNVVRLLPPLIIGEEHAGAATDIIDAACGSLEP